MKNAVEALELGRMTARSAAKAFNVPKTTVGIIARRGEPIERGLRGNPILGEEFEAKIVLCVFDLANAGFPITKNQLIENVSKFLSYEGLADKFVGGKPGRKWFKLFRQRHRSLSQRVAENISKTRAAISEEGIRDWFAQVEQYLKENDCFNALENPKCIFNLNETAVFLSPEANRLIKAEFDNAYCLFNLSGKLFPGQVKVVRNNGQLAVHLIKKSGPNNWKWLTKKNEVILNVTDVQEHIEETQMVNR